MTEFTIIGADCFIGHHLLAALQQEPEANVHCLIYKDDDLQLSSPKNVSFSKGNLLQPGTFEDLIVPNGTVINLAYLWQGSQEENLTAVVNLARKCLDRGAKRLIHISTAVVSGKVSADVLDETTVCQPVLDYEITKYAMEEALLQQLKGRCELVILRPTAVFGPGGKNLLKLANGLTRGSRLISYVKSCLFGFRRMNLVNVSNVVAAIKFLAARRQKIDQEIYIISEEADINNYRKLEKYLMREFNIKDYLVPPFVLPSFILSFFLRLTGKSNINPFTTYSSRKLEGLGFCRPVTFESGLKDFSDWYRQKVGIRV